MWLRPLPARFWRPWHCLAHVVRGSARNPTPYMRHFLNVDQQRTLDLSYFQLGINACVELDLTFPAVTLVWERSLTSMAVGRRQSVAVLATALSILSMMDTVSVCL